MQILIAAGGTGGHIFPAVSLAERLRAAQNIRAEILFICSDKKTDIELLKTQDEIFNVDSLPVHSFGRIFSLKIFNFLVRLYSATLKSYTILRNFKPDVVVGFGGYVSGPVVMLASFMNIPTIIHEQNLIPGRANRILSYFVDKVAVSFKDTQRFFPPKTVFTGNPIRSRTFIPVPKDKARRLLGLYENRFTILVMGGSHGAHTINETMLKIVSLMNEEERNGIQIIHLCGDADKKMVEAKYKDIGIANTTFTFSLKMDQVYSAADLVIARAGATTLAEVAYFGLPSILIPYPYSKYHQYANAKFFADKGAAILVEQDSRLTDNLRLSISLLIKDSLKLSAIADSMKQLAISNAAGDLAEEVLKLAPS